MSDLKPWEADGATEAQYFKAKYLEARVRERKLMEALERIRDEAEMRQEWIFEGLASEALNERDV